MKIIDENRNEIKMEKKFQSFFAAFVIFLIFAILNFFIYYYDAQEIILPSYVFIALAIIFLLFSGKRLITFSKMTGELVVENNRYIKKTKKIYLLKEIDCIVKKNKRELRRVHGSNRLLKVAKYYLSLRDGTLISLFSYPLSSNFLFGNKSSVKEKEEVLKNLDIITQFLGISIK